MAQKAACVCSKANKWIKCQHSPNVDKGYTSILCAIFATFCKSAIIPSKKLNKKKKRAPAFDCTTSNMAVMSLKKNEFPSFPVDLIAGTSRWHQRAPNGEAARASPGTPRRPAPRCSLFKHSFLFLLGVYRPLKPAETRIPERYFPLLLLSFFLFLFLLD